MAEITDDHRDRDEQCAGYFGIKMEKFHKNGKKNEAKKKTEQIHGKKTHKFRNNGEAP
jgi:hypothetical protein